MSGGGLTGRVLNMSTTDTQNVLNLKLKLEAKTRLETTSQVVALWGYTKVILTQPERNMNAAS